MSAEDLVIMGLSAMKDFAGYDGPLDHPIIVPLRSTLRADVAVTCDLKQFEINSVYRDGNYSTGTWIDLCPELEEQFKFLAELLQDEFREKCIVPVRVGRDKAELRESERVVPPIQGHISFEAYLYDAGGFGSANTVAALQKARLEGSTVPDGVIAAQIVAAFGYGEWGTFDYIVKDVVRLYERRHQIRKLIELMDDEASAIELADGPIVQSGMVPTTLTRYFDDGYPYAVIVNLGAPFNSENPGQMYYCSPETYDL